MADEPKVKLGTKIATGVAALAVIGAVYMGGRVTSPEGTLDVTPSKDLKHAAAITPEHYQRVLVDDSSKAKYLDARSGQMVYPRKIDSVMVPARMEYPAFRVPERRWTVMTDESDSLVMLYAEPSDTGAVLTRWSFRPSQEALDSAGGKILVGIEIITLSGKNVEVE